MKKKEKARLEGVPSKEILTSSFVNNINFSKYLSAVLWAHKLDHRKSVVGTAQIFAANPCSLTHLYYTSVVPYTLYEWFPKKAGRDLVHFREPRVDT